MEPAKPHLIPGEIMGEPTLKYAWIPCWTEQGWVWGCEVWAWPVMQKWMIHPVSFTLYTRKEP